MSQAFLHGMEHPPVFTPAIQEEISVLEGRTHDAISAWQSYEFAIVSAQERRKAIIDKVNGGAALSSEEVLVSFFSFCVEHTALDRMRNFANREPGAHRPGLIKIIKKARHLQKWAARYNDQKSKEETPVASTYSALVGAMAAAKTTLSPPLGAEASGSAHSVLYGLLGEIFVQNSLNGHGFNVKQAPENKDALEGTDLEIRRNGHWLPLQVKTTPPKETEIGFKTNGPIPIIRISRPNLVQRFGLSDGAGELLAAEMRQYLRHAK